MGRFAPFSAHARLSNAPLMSSNPTAIARAASDRAFPADRA
jgi:hypothetical protein